MKSLLLAIAILSSPLFTLSQDITGLWKGTLYNDSSKQTLPYEVLISKEKGKFIGYSHSYFMVDGKQYYGVKKVKVTVAKDGKVVIMDDAMLENNYPETDKKVRQLNVLDLTTANDQAVLAGPFATNRTKKYGELTGQVSLKKADAGTESALLNFLQRNNVENAIAASK